MILHYKKGAIFFPSATRPGGGGGSEATLYNFKTAPDKATTKYIENNVFIISIIWLHNLIDTITIIGRHSPLSRGGHFASGDQEKLCLCTASLVERTRVAVHKQNFLNLLRQNGGRVAKVYYDVILVNLLAGPNFQFLPWPKILIKIVRCAMKSRSWLTHFESLTFAVKKAQKKPPRSK